MPNSHTDSGECGWLWSTAQTRASQPRWGMQGGAVILFVEVTSDDHLSDHEDCNFFLHVTTLSAVPSHDNIATLCWG